MTKLRALPVSLIITILFFTPVGRAAPNPAANQSLKTEADSLHALGDSLIKAGKYDSAQVVLQSEVKLRETLFDSVGLAKCLNSLCRTLELELKFEEGLRAGERALSICKLTVGEDDTLAARSFNNIGLVYYVLRNYKKALENLNKAFAIRLETLGPDHLDVAHSYYNIGLVYDELGNYQKALENNTKALAIQLKALGPEHPEVAACYIKIGSDYRNCGDYEKALEYYNKALAIQLKTLGADHPEVAESYIGIGNVYYCRSDYAKALENYNKALAIQLKVLGSDHPDVAASYSNIGNVYDELGNYQKALENNTKALAIQLKALGPEHPEVARSDIRMGNAYRHLGDYEKALGYHNKALAIELKALGPEHPDVAMSYGNIGNDYRDLGDYEKALENFNKALAIELKALGPEHRDVAASYYNIGADYFDLGDYEKALENFTRALAIHLKALGMEDPYAAAIYIGVGYVYDELGDHEKSLENFNKALAINLKVLGPENPDVATCYSAIGAVYCDLGYYEKALEYHNKAFSIWLKVLGPDHPYVALSYYNMGKVFRARKDLNTALGYLKKSIAITEKVRGGVNSEELKKTYTESVRDYYDAIITLLLEMGRPKEAFEYYERSKSKLLQDELQKEGVEIGKGEVRKKLGQVQSLSNQVGALEKQVIDEKSKPKSEQNSTKIENLTRLLAQTKGEFYKLVTEIKQNPDYAFTVTVDPMQFASIQKDLPAGNKLIMYYSSKDKLYILVVSNDGFRATSVDISRDSLDLLVRQFRTLIDTFQVSPDTSRTALLKTVITTLYRYLIAPIQDAVTSATNLTFIPSGNLYYIPLGALAYEKDGKLRYLVEDKPVSYLTSAELIRYVERKEKANPKGSPDLLLIGDPAGADLPGAADEAKAIHTLYPKSKLYLDADATKSTVEREAPLSQILHLATHAFPDQQSPWDSYVYLVKAGADNGRWTMSEITNQTWDKMTLVTLSACETAIGGDKPGLEMESMARAFSIAGAPSIVATLWPVYDPSTKDLMVGFYKNLKTMSKVEALRQAQLSLLQNPRYSHPYFWAPFILIGDWK